MMKKEIHLAFRPPAPALDKMLDLAKAGLPFLGAKLLAFG